jgi:hypothetical protein
MKSALALVACAAAVAQQSASSPARLLLVDAGVTFEGHSQIGLSREDFRIAEGKTAYTIVRFEGEERPLDVLIVFDTVSGVRSALDAIGGAAHEALKELRAGDRVGIMVHGSESRVILPFSTDMDAVEKAIRTELPALEYGGVSRLQSAADDAAKVFLAEKDADRRRAVLHVELGTGVVSRFEPSIFKKYWEAGAVYNALAIHKYAGTMIWSLGGAMSPGLGLLSANANGIVHNTGGVMVSGHDPGAAFQDALHRIRQRYSLWIEHPRSKYDGIRKFQVKLSEDAAKRFPKAKVYARTGYHVPWGSTK